MSAEFTNQVFDRAKEIPTSEGQKKYLYDQMSILEERLIKTQSQLLETESRAISLVFRIPNDKLAGEVQAWRDEMKRELESLRKDKERLDWLDRDSNQARSAKSRMAFSPEDLSRIVIDEEKSS